MNQLLQNGTGILLVFEGSRDNELGVLALMPKPPEVFAVFPELPGKGRFPPHLGRFHEPSFPKLC